jgi:opacity protein-like surface antigen
MRTIRLAAAVAAPLAIAASAAAITPAFAQGGGIQKSGSCSAASDWKLKASTEDGGRLEVEAEVDSNVVGQTWEWQLKDNGTRVAVGRNQTVAPSGSFEVRRFITNQAGTDTIKFAAINRATNELCLGSLVI